MHSAGTDFIRLWACSREPWETRGDQKIRSRGKVETLYEFKRWVILKLILCSVKEIVQCVHYLSPFSRGLTTPVALQLIPGGDRRGKLCKWMPRVAHRCDLVARHVREKSGAL